MEEKTIAEQLMRAQHRFIKAHKRITFPEMRKSEFIVLDMIQRGKIKGKSLEGVSVSELAKNLLVTTPAVSKILRDMEEKGYIKRETDKNDRRNTIVKVTKKGEQARKETCKRMDLLMQNSINRLGEENTEELIRLLNQLTDFINEESLNMKTKKQEEEHEADF